MDVSDILYFFLVGEGEGGVRGARRGRGRFLIENPRRVGGFQEGEGRGAGRVSAANWEIFLGRGAKYFFSGPKRPPSRLATANGFANEMVKISFSLQRFLANGRLQHNSLAIANATAWCTQVRRGVWKGSPQGEKKEFPFQNGAQKLGSFPKHLLRQTIALNFSSNSEVTSFFFGGYF